MNDLEQMLQRIREYHAAPKEERKRIAQKPKTNLRTRMIIKHQRNKFKSNE